MQPEIKSNEDIKTLVDSFYDKVRKDDLLGPIFNKFIKEWPKHLEKMYLFWHTLLFHEQKYTGNPFQPHIKLPISKKHFDRWTMLFEQNVDEHFQGQIAHEAKQKANRIADTFQAKLNHLNNPV